jgi:putative endonuclease
MSWKVYILECRDKTLYTGITNDLSRRLAMHEIGTGAKYTRGRGPLKVIYIETKKSKGTALKREIEIKAMTKVQKHELAFKSRIKH